MDDSPKPRHLIRSVLVNVVFLALMAGGGFQIYRGVSALVTAYVSTSWPTARALITESAIHRDLGAEPDLTSIIEYSYDVNGRHFTGNTVYPGDSSTSSFRLRMVSRYLQGSKQLVHYQPDKPAIATLETGLHQHTFIKFLFGSLIFSFGAAFGSVSLLSRQYPTFATSEGHSFPIGHPVSKLILGWFFLIATQFGLIWCFHR